MYALKHWRICPKHFPLIKLCYKSCCLLDWWNQKKTNKFSVLIHLMTTRKNYLTRRTHHRSQPMKGKAGDFLSPAHWFPQQYLKYWGIFKGKSTTIPIWQLLEYYFAFMLWRGSSSRPFHFDSYTFIFFNLFKRKTGWSCRAVCPRPQFIPPFHTYALPFHPLRQ